MDIHKKIREGRERLRLTQQEFADKVGVSRPAVQQWENGATAPKRGIQDAVARALGISKAELLSDEPLPPVGVAQALSYLSVKVTALTWSDLRKDRTVPEVFQLELVDNSMAPRAVAGEAVIFTKGITPRPGDGVIVKDRDGNHFFREYREGRAGSWQAFAYNSAFQSLDALVDGLSVVAVLTATPNRWSR